MDREEGSETMTMGIDDWEIIRDDRNSMLVHSEMNWKIADKLYKYLKKYGPFLHTVKQGNLSNLTYEHIAMVDLLRQHLVTFRKRGMYLATYDGGDGKIGVYCPQCALKIMNMRGEVKRLLNVDEMQINAFENDGWSGDVHPLPAETQELLRTSIDWSNKLIRRGCDILNIGEAQSINVLNFEVIRFDVKAMNLKEEFTPDCICDHCQVDSKFTLYASQSVDYELEWQECANAQLDYIIKEVQTSPSLKFSLATQEIGNNGADY